jgi:hypothetical protein
VGQVVSITILHFTTFRSKLHAFKYMGLLVPSLNNADGLQFKRLLGTGSGNGFGMTPAFGRYVFLAVWESEKYAASFFKENAQWIDYSSACRRYQTVYMRCCAVHGSWMGEQPFDTGMNYDSKQPTAVITRATIKWLEMLRFWSSVPAVNHRLRSAFKPLYAVGVGEWPLRFQATFSIWSDGEEMEDFAYKDESHKAMVKKTRAVKWYKEELFARFHLLRWEGDNIIGI